MLSSLQSVQFSCSVMWLFATPWTAAHQASLSITNSQSLLKLMSIALVIPFNHLILCHPLLLPPSIFPIIRVFSNESVLCTGTIVCKLQSTTQFSPIWWNYCCLFINIQKCLIFMETFSCQSFHWKAQIHETDN